MIDDTGWQEGDTLLTTTDHQDEPASAAPVPALTILAHSDSTRVGERLALPALAAGFEVRLSRLEPVFSAPGHSELRPLENRHLSRRPVRLTAGEQPGSVNLDCRTTRTNVVADGRPIAERQDFSATELEHGVVLMLARRVVLLLHCLPVPIPEEAAGFGLVGDSPALVRLRREIRRLAALDVPVMLCGETGTGKELAARALHAAGPRRQQPFVAVNMATLPPNLAAAELFGAARGAYTGADRKKAGLFRHAQHGTLFLDEIGEAPVEVQPMLLRALENHEIRPVGSTETVAIDVRIVAATDADLETAIASGKFRAPLYHRLAGYAVRLPPLRERRDDLGRLCVRFLAEELAKLDETPPPTPEDEHSWPPVEVMARLARYDWPGNVRELRNTIRRLVVIGRDATPEELRAQVDEILGPSTKRPIATTKPQATNPKKTATTRRRLRKCSDVDEKELLAALEAHRFELKPTAQALGLSRINLYRLIESCSAVRKAVDLERQEITGALERCSGDLAAAALELRVSLQGLKRRMTMLDLPHR